MIKLDLWDVINARAPKERAIRGSLQDGQPSDGDINQAEAGQDRDRASSDAGQIETKGVQKARP